MDKLHQCNYHKEDFMDAEQELQGILDVANYMPRRINVVVENGLIAEVVNLG